MMAVYNMECGVCKEPCTESELFRINNVPSDWKSEILNLPKDKLMCEVCVNELIEELRA